MSAKAAIVIPSRPLTAEDFRPVPRLECRTCGCPLEFVTYAPNECPRTLHYRCARSPDDHPPTTFVHDEVECHMFGSSA